MSRILEKLDSIIKIAKAEDDSGDGVFSKDVLLGAGVGAGSLTALYFLNKLRKFLGSHALKFQAPLKWI